MMTMDEMVESLYDLDANELRRLALEALLISDGPDKVVKQVWDDTATFTPVAPPTAEEVRRAHERQEKMRPEALQVIRHYVEGKITVEDMQMELEVVVDGVEPLK